MMLDLAPAPHDRRAIRFCSGNFRMAQHFFAVFRFPLIPEGNVSLLRCHAPEYEWFNSPALPRIQAGNNQRLTSSEAKGIKFEFESEFEVCGCQSAE
jgi:hypothetical protein